MSLKRPHLLITSAINPSAPFTSVQDPTVRLKSTIEALKRWGNQLEHLNGITVCDGSGFDLTPHIQDAGVPCTALAFKNEVEKVDLFGKGFGEGQIVKYALSKCPELAGSDVFVKCTGKLWVDNFAKILRRFNGSACFDYIGGLRPRRLDTRFYIVSRRFFERRLADAYLNVDDRGGKYLEDVYFDQFRDLRLIDYAMTPVPRVRGLSGSMGIEYGHSILRHSLRNWRTRVAKFNWS